MHESQPSSPEPNEPEPRARLFPSSLDFPPDFSPDDHSVYDIYEFQMGLDMGYVDPRMLSGRKPQDSGHKVESVEPQQGDKPN